MAYKYSLLVKKNLYFRNLFIFLFFYIIFFLVHKNTYYDNVGILLFVNILLCIVFIITAFKPKIGLYLFIFFIPLLNSLTTILGIRPVPTLLFIFFGFFLGFILSFFEKDYRNRLNLTQCYYYDRDISIASIVFLIILIISLGITVFRYANFYPFLTNNYYNLFVNNENSLSSSTIPWVVSYFFNYAIGFLLLFSVFNILDRKGDIIVTFVIIIVATTITSLFAMYQYFINPNIGTFSYWVEGGRINSTFTDPNSLGAYCVLIFPIFLSFFIFVKRWYLRLLAGLLFVLFIFMAFFSGSRSVILAIILSLLIFAIIGIIKYVKTLSAVNIKKKIIILVVIFCVILIVIAVFSVVLFTENKVKNELMKISFAERSLDTIDSFISHLKKDGFVEAVKTISNYRYFYWNMAINMAKDFPLHGVGIGSYITELPDYLSRFETGFYQIDFAGNYYLQVLSELGFPGLILILFIFFTILKKAFNYYKYKRLFKGINKNDWLLTGLLISFISMLFILLLGPHTNFAEIQFTFWVDISLILTYIKINQIKSYKETDLPIIIKSFQKKEPLLLSGKIRFTFSQKVSLSLILLIFFSSFMMNSLTKLSIYSKQDYGKFENDYGFNSLEKLGGKKVRWTLIDASEVLDKKGNVLILPIQDGYPADEVKIKEPPETLVVKVYIDNYLVKKIKLEDYSWYNIKINIPDFARNRFTLTLVMNRSWVPKNLGLNQDTRELGARIGELSFED